MKWISILVVALISVPNAFAKMRAATLACATELNVAPRDPAQLYGQLFVDVQLSAAFADSKHFPDLTPRTSVAEVLEAYRHAKPRTAPDLRRFVESQFLPLAILPAEVVGVLGQTSDEHIQNLWPLLSREAHRDLHAANSLVALDEAYIVPGGRFNEIYYWDSYFTQLGLLADLEDEKFQSLVRVFDKMIHRLGFIPNGNRSYYLSRSQPPVFALMVALWQERFGVESATQFLPALKKEHAFWMDGAESLAPGQAHRRVVRLADGQLLNRFWDDKDSPRTEAYKEDLELAHEAGQKHGREPGDVLRDVRAAAESGWDFSSRWFSDPEDFTTIETTSLAPVDLNAFLYFAEQKIAELERAAGDMRSALIYSTRAAERRQAINRHLWDGEIYQDLNWRTNYRTERASIATTVPLFVGLATPEQAARVASYVETRFLRAGGVATTLRRSGQQWDAPNGWAPCQWMAFAGLSRYGHLRLANEIRHRWLATNDAVFKRTGKMMEKYNVEHPELEAGGGEYEGQDGFGWTNGVYKGMKNPGQYLRHLGVAESVLHQFENPRSAQVNP